MARTKKDRRPAEAVEPLDVDRVVQAALDLLNEVGSDQLTMRRLAQSLGIRAASLYWHVRDKAELLQLLADAICARVRPPAATLPWEDQIRSLAGEYRAALLSVRDSAEILAATLPFTPRRLALIESVLRILESTGLPPAQVWLSASFLNNYVLSFVADEMRFSGTAKEKGISLAELHASARDMHRSLPAEQYSTMVRLADQAVSPDMAGQFQFGLEILIDGLRARLAART